MNNKKTFRASLIQFTLILAMPLTAFAITSESEPNNSDSVADGPLVSGTTVAGSINNNSDEDWFEFNVTSTGTISIDLDHNSRDDFDWFLYRETGGSIASGATSAVPETGSYNATQTGTYFLRVDRYSGRGWYDLTVTFPTGGGSGGGGGGGGGTTRPSKPSNITNYVTGNAADAGVNPVNGPGIMLMGGNFDIDEAFINRAYPVVNGGDVVVLRTSGTNGYNDYLYNLVSGSLKPDSVETLIVDTVSKANTTFVQWVVENAEMIYIAGGDQSDYMNAWKGTALEAAVNTAYNRGAVIGGISAGCAVQGEFVYDPDGVPGVITSEAVDDPYNSSMIISDKLFNFPLMDNIITDTHFSERDRMGRLMTFMARLREDGRTSSILGVGVGEDTSMFIDKNGIGYVDGDFEVYVLEEDGGTVRNQINPGQAAIYTGVVRNKLLVGDTFNFNNNTSSVSTIDISINGGNPNNPYTPTNPY